MNGFEDYRDGMDAISVPDVITRCITVLNSINVMEARSCDSSYPNGKPM